ATQEALMDYLRRQASDARPLFMTTRSSIVLNMDAVGPEEAIIHCPANHSPPTLVASYPGAPGYEAVISCLAPPDVRARTAGVVAHRPEPMV
ncbi:MAG: MerR family transcriptional regulator, partial [Rhizobiales bacterium]|nr:MerR family transcriptional regulator [Hyphomicrobiales bacterium]